MSLKLFSTAYIDAIYFTETGDSDQPSNTATLSELSRCNALNDCANFYRAYSELIGDNIEQAGHDFWLTRNGHGAGFWDRPEIYGAEIAQELTRASKACGETWPDFEEQE
jgi:hypothetical protein